MSGGSEETKSETRPGGTLGGKSISSQMKKDSPRTPGDHTPLVKA